MALAAASLGGATEGTRTTTRPAGPSRAGAGDVRPDDPLRRGLAAAFVLAVLGLDGGPPGADAGPDPC